MDRNRAILVVDEDQRCCQYLCRILLEQNLLPFPLYSVLGLDEYIQRSKCFVVILDLKTLATHKRSLLSLITRNPGVFFLGLSESHESSLSDTVLGEQHSYRCLDKPVDAQELLFLLKSIHGQVRRERDSVA